ncbi:hypothetical protein KR026_008898 [Drosophila bipectinata]|nr:hypothetical protein KR026_008898 [Drosophila bipectinata]
MGGQSPMRLVQQTARPAQVGPSRAHTRIHQGHDQSLSHGQLTVPRPSRQKHSSPRYLNRYPDFRQLTDSQLDFLASQAREEQQLRVRRENNATYNKAHCEEVEEEDFNTEDLAELGLEEERLRREMNYSEEERLQRHREYSDDRRRQRQTSDEPTDLDGEEESQEEDTNDDGREEVSGELPLNGKRVRKTALEQELLLRQQVQQEDEAEEAEEQRRRMHLREETSPLRMARFSLSSTTTTATTTTPRCVQAPQRGDDPSDDYEMVTAASHSATIAAHQPTCFVPPNADVDTDDEDKKDEEKKGEYRLKKDAGVDPMPSVNHWRKISLMMPFMSSKSRTRTAPTVIEDLDDAAPNVSGISNHGMEIHQQQSLFQRQQEQLQPQPHHHQPQYHVQQPQRQATVYRAPHSEYLMSTIQCVDAVEL